jgi:DNA-binding SARP family transcriptional activator/tetratricopeptide (TPR) repeat protein
MPMSFGVLGPLEIVVDGRKVSVGSGRQRSLLATLLLHANKVVSFDELVEVVWGERGPVHPRAAVHTCVARLRKVLGGVVVEGGVDGYRIVVDEQAVDVYRFEAEVLVAGAAGDREAEVLGRALSLWRGEPLAGVQSDYLQRQEVPRLTERRLLVLERKLGLDVAEGRYAAAVAELQALTAEFPLREKFWALLVTALSGCGRQADALAAYSAVRHQLVDELGVEPGQDLRQAHQAVLAGSPARVPVECQLPLDVDDFTGRDEELAQLLTGLASGKGVPVVVISGPPGMGKSALAVRAAHRLIGDYPDGQWFLRLKGASPGRRTPADLLAEMLRTAGADGASIPADVDARSTLLRSRLAGRKVLIVLDDAASVEQVAPLLPGRPGSAVIVTSRSDLAGLTVLYGGTRLALEPMSEQHAYDLLARIVGTPRCAADMAGTAQLAELCGRLPLALRIAAANLASRPGLAIGSYAADLRTGDRLTQLAPLGEIGVDVRSAFDSSYLALPRPERRAFRLLGLVSGGDIGVAGAAALFGGPADAARQSLDRLVAANLLEYHTEGRYRFHDLIRVYAGDRAAADEPRQERDGAFRRLADWCLHGLHAAVRKCLASVYVSRLDETAADIIPPDFETDGEALRWLDLERTTYLAVIEQAAAAGPVRYSWLLADAARPDLLYTFRYSEWERTTQLGLNCARQAGDQRGEALMVLGFGVLTALTGRFGESAEYLTLCQDIARRIGESGIEAAAMTNMAAMYNEAHRPEEALRAAEAGRRLLSTGVEEAEGRLTAVFAQIADARFTLGELWLSAEAWRTVGDRGMQSRSPVAQLVSAVQLGRIYRETGDYRRSLDNYTRAMDSQVSQHVMINGIGPGLAALYTETGRLDLAYDHAVAARKKAHDSVDNRDGADACLVLGLIGLRAGRLAEALEHYQEALGMAVKSRIRSVEIEALTGMALASGQSRFAVHAVELARERGMRLLEAKASTALAQLMYDNGHMAEARATAESALGIHRESGARPAEAAALALIGRIQWAAGTSSPDCWTEAVRIYEDIGSPLAADVRSLMAGQSAVPRDSAARAGR